MAVGYEMNKIACDEPKNVWTVAEFFGISTLCTWRWIINYCCSNQICANCCINYGKWVRSQDEDAQNTDEAGVDEELTMFETILQNVQMVLGSLESGVLGFDLRYKLFDTMPMKNWDYAKLIKYLTVVKIIIYIIKCGYWCVEGHLFNKVDTSGLGGPFISPSSKSESVPTHFWNECKFKWIFDDYLNIG